MTIINKPIIKITTTIIKKMKLKESKSQFELNFQSTTSFYPTILSTKATKRV